MSRLATYLARLICKADVADPLSGFFMCRREVFERAANHMSGQGFKVLLDMLASFPSRCASVSSRTVSASGNTAKVNSTP
jgi:dolichol-phosphate mannosyltransferase